MSMRIICPFVLISQGLEKLHDRRKWNQIRSISTQSQQKVYTLDSCFVPTIGSFFKEITDFGPMFMTFYFWKQGHWFKFSFKPTFKCQISYFT